jgi:hypothetical protein
VALRKKKYRGPRRRGQLLSEISAHTDREKAAHIVFAYQYRYVHRQIHLRGGVVAEGDVLADGDVRRVEGSNAGFGIDLRVYAMRRTLNLRLRRDRGAW